MTNNIIDLSEHKKKQQQKKVDDILEQPNDVGWYILDENNKPVLAETTSKYSAWMQFNEHRRSVKRTTHCGLTISTVCLFLDHDYSGRSAPNYQPLLWETMLFSGHNEGYVGKARKGRGRYNWVDKDNEHQWRYRSHEAALKHHNELCSIFISPRSMDWIKQQVNAMEYIR